MLVLLELATFGWLGLWALLAFRELALQRRQPILPVFIVHFVFCGLPLLLNLWFGLPEYVYTPGFYLATRDELTAVVYCFYVSLAPPIWWFWGRNRTAVSGGEAASTVVLQRLLERLRPLFVLFLVSPLIAWMLAPDPALYLRYGVAALHEFNAGKRSVLTIFSDPARYKDVLFTTSLLCVVGTGGLIAGLRRLHIAHVYMLAPWIGLAIWLNGKRYIVVLSMFLIGYLLWERGVLHGKRLVVAAAVAVVLLIGYAFAYQAVYRGANLTDQTRWYENVRMDYGRDDVIKLAIFAELHPAVVQILEYRGQSVLFYSVFFVPRELWAQKPYPYAVYSTSAISLFDEPRQLGWGITTSILEEALANFSWAGLLIGPLVIVLVCRIGAACHNSLVSALTALLACLFLAVHLNAFMNLFLLWLAAVGTILLMRYRQRLAGRRDASHWQPGEA